MPSDDTPERPHERIERFDDDRTHRIEVSPRMLRELLTFGTTTSAGTSEFGPELVVLDYVDAERRGTVSVVEEALKTLGAGDNPLEETDAD